MIGSTRRFIKYALRITLSTRLDCLSQLLLLYEVHSLCPDCTVILLIGTEYLTRCPSAAIVSYGVTAATLVTAPDGPTTRSSRVTPLSKI